MDVLPPLRPRIHRSRQPGVGGLLDLSSSRIQRLRALASSLSSGPVHSSLHTRFMSWSFAWYFLVKDLLEQAELFTRQAAASYLSSRYFPPAIVSGSLDELD